MNSNLDCAGAIRLLHQRLDGNLAMSAADPLDGHLASCTRCRRHADALGALVARTATLPVPPIPDVTARVMAALADPGAAPLATTANIRNGLPAPAPSRGPGPGSGSGPDPRARVGVPVIPVPWVAIGRPLAALLVAACALAVAIVPGPMALFWTPQLAFAHACEAVGEVLPPASLTTAGNGALHTIEGLPGLIDDAGAGVADAMDLRSSALIGSFDDLAGSVAIAGASAATATATKALRDPFQALFLVLSLVPLMWLLSRTLLAPDSVPVRKEALS